MTNAMQSAPDQTTELVRTVTDDVLAMPWLHRFADVVPAADLIFGGAILILVVLVHAVGLRLVGNYVSRRITAIMRHPHAWRSDLLMAGLVFALLALHLFEVFIWAAALVESGLVSNWRDAGFFAGNTYTTIGYGQFILPQSYAMIAPIMAISGLFTFGWSGSVLVDYVRRFQQIHDKAFNLKHPGKEKHSDYG